MGNVRGTPGYFPNNFQNDPGSEWLPRIMANDTIFINGELPMEKNRKLVYKIDSYCFGRVLYYLRYAFETTKDSSCCLFSETERKIDKIISSLTENDVNKRFTVEQCLKLIF